MTSFGSICFKNSFIGRINPCIKFLIYIIFVAILFIPSSLVVQIVFCFFIYGLFFLARLPQRIFWKTFFSVLVILFFLILINWFTYRNPGYFVVDSQTDVKQLGQYYDNDISNAFSVHIWCDGKNFFVNNQKFTPAEFIEKFIINQKTTASDKLVKYFEGKDFYLGALWGGGNPPGSTDKGWYQFQLNFAENSSDIRGVTLICYATPYALSFRSIVISIYVFFKIFTLIILSTILTSTTTSIELTYALEDLLFPLKIFRFPVNEFAMILSITIRYIPTLLIETHRIMNAQAARGVDFQNGRLKDKVNSITSLVIPMFSVAFRKADELAFAMEARGYNPRYLRSRYRHFSLKLSDMIIFAFAMALLCFFIVFSVKNVWISLFGSFDWLVLFAKNFAST